MSQGQERRPDSNQQPPIKYGDKFPVSGELANKPIAPQDAAMMQSAENALLGQTQKGGVASTMQSAAMRNEEAGVVRHMDVTDIAAEEGVTAAETDVPGGRIIAESIAGQVLGTYAQPVPGQPTRNKTTAITIGEALEASALTAGDKPVDQSAAAAILGTYAQPVPGQPTRNKTTAITIGEALEASALTAGDKPVDQSDAAAIQAAKVRATGSNVITPGGVAAMAQSAATANARMVRDEDKTKLGDILTDVSLKLPADKIATREDAEGVMGAELRNNPNLATHPGGVAASVVAAAAQHAAE